MAKSTPLLRSHIVDLSQPDKNQTVGLPDGRLLGFAEFGAPKGIPIFFMHGYPGSRVDGMEWHGTAIEHGFRIICIDRPGFGLSTFQPNRKLLDMPDDIRHLAQHLGINSYYVFGQSGGGAYTVACAYALLREELKGAVAIAGMAPWKFGTAGMRFMNRLGFWLLAYAPWLMRLILLCTNRGLLDYPQEKLEKIYKDGLKNFKGKERAIFEDPETMKAVIASLRETFRQGNDGFMHDGHIYTSDFGFDLEQVKHPNIRLYYGTEDTNTPYLTADIWRSISLEQS